MPDVPKQKAGKSGSKTLPLDSPAHFFWCCRRATQLDVDISGFPSVMAHYKRMQERPSVKKLLAYEKEVNEEFAKSA